MHPPSMMGGGARMRLGPPEFAFSPGEVLELSTDTPPASRSMPPPPSGDPAAGAGDGSGSRKETSWLIPRTTMSAACTQALHHRRRERLSEGDIMAKLFAADVDAEPRDLAGQFEVNTAGSSLHNGGSVTVGASMRGAAMQGEGSPTSGRMLSQFARGHLTTSVPGRVTGGAGI